jgi:hypothetical protein
MMHDLRKLHCIIKIVRYRYRMHSASLLLGSTVVLVLEATSRLGSLAKGLDRILTKLRSVPQGCRQKAHKLSFTNDS